MEQRWWRRPETGLLAGVCEGIGEKFDLSPWVIRGLWLSTVLFLGTGLLFYIFAAISFPSHKNLPSANQKVILGVCLNLASRLKTAPEILRFLCLVLALASLGGTLVVYFAMAFIFPAPHDLDDETDHSLNF